MKLGQLAIALVLLSLMACSPPAEEMVSFPIEVTEYCNYPPEALGKEKIGGFSTPDIELMPI